jgi:hypothetical protein
MSMETKEEYKADFWEDASAIVTSIMANGEDEVRMEVILTGVLEWKVIVYHDQEAHNKIYGIEVREV